MTTCVPLWGLILAVLLVAIVVHAAHELLWQVRCDIEEGDPRD